MLLNAIRRDVCSLLAMHTEACGRDGLEGALLLGYWFIPAKPDPENRNRPAANQLVEYLDSQRNRVK